MDNFSLAWVAGLLEGEGYFGTSAAGGQVYAVIQCNMTDLDILQVLQTVTGGGRINGPYPTNPLHKPSYAWKVSGTEARRLMRALMPMMGQRRQGQIAAALSADTHGDFTETRPLYQVIRGI